MAVDIDQFYIIQVIGGYKTPYIGIISKFMGDDEIIHIPKELFNIIQLKLLNLCRILRGNLPDRYINLVNLEYLYLQGCGIENSLIKLKSLKHINIQNNNKITNLNYILQLSSIKSIYYDLKPTRREREECNRRNILLMCYN